MSDNVVNFWSGFRSQNDEQADALADPVTNTLDIFVPSENKGEMTLVHAFVSREEFMHGEWNIGLLVQIAQLRLAAIQSLLAAIEEPERREEHVARFKHVNGRAVDIQNQLGPFQEAVDKLQILSVTHGDEEFQNSIVQVFRSGYEDSDYPIQDELDDRIQTQYEAARGKISLNEEDESLYINPLYYYALDEIASEYGDEGEESGGVSTGRSIAETVARATLDIVHPIAPLAPSAEATFEPLGQESLTVEQTTLEDLEAKFEITDEAYERHLLTHESKIESADVRRKLGLGKNPDPSELERTLVDKLFVSCLQALEAVEANYDVTELDADDIRRLLVEELHGVDIGDPETETVLDNENPLLALPRDAAESKPDQDFVNLESDPLPKILIEAFEQHGAFATVRFRRTEEDLSRQLNWNVLNDPLPDHPTVPDGVDSYQHMWEHYYFGKSLVEDLLSQQRPYVVDRILDHFDDDVETATEELNAVFSGRPASSGLGTGTDKSPDARSRFASLGAVDGVKDRLSSGSKEVVHSDGPESDSDDPADDTNEGDEPTVFEGRSLAELLSAAERLGIDLGPPGDVDQPPAELSVECPFCEFSYDLCGNDRCVTEARRRRYESARPELVWTLLKAP